MSTTPWTTGLPELPENYTFDIDVVKDGTYVHLREFGLHGTEFAVSFVSSQYHEPETEYLAKVWNAANELANKLKDRLEREQWILTHFPKENRFK